MAIFNPGDVVYAAFPYTDLPLHKQRPVVVLSSPAYQSLNHHLIGAMITTGKDSSWHGDVRLKDPETAGLKTPSVVRMKIFTLPLDLVIKPLGHLSQPDMLSVRAALMNVVTL
jgi:mRNA interferase MazF